MFHVSFLYQLFRYSFFSTLYVPVRHFYNYFFVFLVVLKKNVIPIRQHLKVSRLLQNSLMTAVIHTESLRMTATLQLALTHLRFVIFMKIFNSLQLTMISAVERMSVLVIQPNVIQLRRFVQLEQSILLLIKPLVVQSRSVLLTLGCLCLRKAMCQQRFSVLAS